MRKFALFVMCSVFLLGGVEALAGTYYIDCAGGSDSNSGTSQTTPWLHHPYMVGWSGSYSHTAGDQFYFKGGVTCPNSYFPLTVAAGGTSSNYDYYGPDSSLSWYSGNSWTRPIFSGGGAVIGGGNVMVNGGSVNYVQFDNFEVTGFVNSGPNVYQDNSIFLSNAQTFSWTNNYIHGWINNTSGCSGGCSYPDNIVAFMGCNGCSGGNQNGSLVDHNYVNGADATPPSTSDGNGSLEAFRYIDGGTISNNVVRNVSNCLVTGQNPITLHDNDCGFVYISFDPANHENLFEFQNSGNSIYNNRYHDTTNVGVWPMPLAPKSGQTDWVFNNLCYNVAKDCLSIDTKGSFPTYTANIYNNTFVPGSGEFCVDTTDRDASFNIGTLNLVNNHCISSLGTAASSWCFAGTSTCSGVTVLIETTNTLMTPATAAAQGYSATESFVYSPTAATNATVGAGTNENFLATGNLAALASESTYACTVNSSNAVVCPARTSLSRGGSCRPTVGTAGCWDTGANLLSASGSAPPATPAPPSGLQAVVQ